MNVLLFKRMLFSKRLSLSLSGVNRVNTDVRRLVPLAGTKINSPQALSKLKLFINRVEVFW